MDGLPTVYRELLDKAFHISRVTEARDFVSNRSGFGILNYQAMVVAAPSIHSHENENESL